MNAIDVENNKSVAGGWLGADTVDTDRMAQLNNKAPVFERLFFEVTFLPYLYSGG